MKILSKIFTILMVFIAFGCEDKLSELGQVDPNTSLYANDSEILTSSIGYLGYINDVDLNFGSFLWAQYYTWGIGVSIGNAERFVSEPDDNDGYWQRAYANCLQDLRVLRESEDDAYRGASKVLSAYIFQGLVDHFGDVPYSQANRGEKVDGGILTPEYDDAATIYGELITLLDDGINDFNNATATEKFNMADDDLLFGGDYDQWIKFANSLKLRIYLRTSEVADNSTEVQELISLGTFIESPADMPVIPFTNTTGQQNPMFARAEFGVGDFYFASNATLDYLNAQADPRRFAFYSLATTGTFIGTLRGIDQGTIDDEPFTAAATNYSGSSPYAYSADNDVILMSSWEVWFLRAEAAARYGTNDDETTAFGIAITENFNYTSTAGSVGYIAGLSYDAAGPLDDRLNMIGIQKWISMNGTQEDEGWIETRRFDRPGNRIFTGAGGIFQDPPLSVLPARTFPSAWLYPATERSLNPNARPQRTITDRIFWDN